MPSRNSSITTVELACPNFESKSIDFSSDFASLIDSIIKTPLPAAKPSAFSTYGGERVSRKSYPSCNESLSKDLYLAVGILCLCINSLANFLLPSN